MKARIGATIAGTSTLPTRPSVSTASKPTAATAEPTTPPISACEELEGSPKDQVIRFQAIAPIRPAKTIVGVITSALTTSLATVAATEIEMHLAEVPGQRAATQMSAGFEQKDRAAAARKSARRTYAGGASAHDDDVEVVAQDSV